MSISCQVFIAISIFLAFATVKSQKVPLQGQTLDFKSSVLGTSDFECPGEQGYYPHPELCEKYYGCWNYVPTLYTCNSRQLFDMRYRGCNWPELTDCQNRTRPQGYPKPPSGSNTTPSSGESYYDCPMEVEDAMFPDKKDCSSYYRCVHGTSYHYKCAPPLVFNEQANACDYRANVNCGSRP